MSTRGLIAIQNENGEVRSIYCHHDCYLEGAGEILVNNYTTQTQVEELLQLGDLSGLGEKISRDPTNPKYQDVCFAYHRDRGEKYQEPVVWDNADTMLKNAEDRFWAEYCYLFKDGEWYFDTTYDPKGWRLVKDGLELLKNEN